MGHEKGGEVYAGATDDRVLFRLPSGEAAVGLRRGGRAVRRLEGAALPGGGDRLRRGLPPLYLRHGAGRGHLLRGDRAVAAAAVPGHHAGGRHPLSHAGGRLDAAAAGAVAGRGGAVRLRDGGAGSLHRRVYAAAEPVHGGSRLAADRRL